LVDGEVAMILEEAMEKVWREALVEGAAEVELDGKRFAVRETPRKPTGRRKVRTRNQKLAAATPSGPFGVVVSLGMTSSGDASGRGGTGANAEEGHDNVPLQRQDAGGSKRG